MKKKKETTIEEEFFKGLNLSPNLSEEEEREIFIDCISSFQRELARTIAQMGHLKVETPLAYSLMAFSELFDAILSSHPKDQIKIISGLLKFLEIIPESKDKAEKSNRELAIIALRSFIKRWENRLK